jgi:hypothetical protein
MITEKTPCAASNGWIMVEPKRKSNKHTRGIMLVVEGSPLLLHPHDSLPLAYQGLTNPLKHHAVVGCTKTYKMDFYDLLVWVFSYIDSLFASSRATVLAWCSLVACFPDAAWLTVWFCEVFLFMPGLCLLLLLL